MFPSKHNSKYGVDTDLKKSCENMFSPWLVPTLAHRSWMKLLLFLVLDETFRFRNFFSSSSIKLFLSSSCMIFFLLIVSDETFIFPRLEWIFCFPSLDLIFLFWFLISFSLFLTKLFFSLSSMNFFSFYFFLFVGFHSSSMKIFVHG